MDLIFFDSLPVKWWPSIKIQNVDSSTIVYQWLHHAGVPHLTGSEQRRVFQAVHGINLCSMVQQKLNRWGVTGQTRRMKGWT